MKKNPWFHSKSRVEVNTWFNVSSKNKHYRVYSSRVANAYKKYHGKVRKSIANDSLSSLAAHKSWLTRELQDIKCWYKNDITTECKQILTKKGLISA